MPPGLIDHSVLYCDTPERADAELQHTAARVHQLIDDLEPTIGRERAAVLDNAVCDLRAAYQVAVTARLVATLTAINEGDHDCYIAPRGGVR